MGTVTYLTFIYSVNRSNIIIGMGTYLAQVKSQILSTYLNSGRFKDNYEQWNKMNGVDIARKVKKSSLFHNFSVFIRFMFSWNANPSL